MCGIAGKYSTEVPPDAADLVAMNGCLSHRGPDDEEIYLDGPVGLAHKRLSIIDLQTGQQPIFNEDGSVAVIFNGEIYNYLDLRESLSSDGHTFETETDTEVLVHLYEEHGLSFIEYLQGMFAFALWDANKERLILGRDRMGIKPLCLADDGNAIAFASELPALLESNVDHGGINEQAVSMYFAFGYIPAPRSIFENIRKLPPGKLIVVDDTGARSEKFYTPTIKCRDPNFEAAVTELRDRFESAVEHRLISDVPLGAFLSGGIDSSIIVGMMASLMDDPVKTFTIGFEETLFDESGAAREVADFHDTDHTEYTVTPREVRSAIPEVLDRIGEPFADQSVIPTYVVSRETSQDVKVALSGDGADELFAGYSRYRGEYYSKYYRKLPSFVRHSLVAPVTGKLDVARDSSYGEFVRKTRKFVRGDIEDTPNRHFEWARIADDDALSVFDGIDPATLGRESMRQEHETAQSFLPPMRQDDMSKIQAVDTYFGLPNQILHKTDLASMYNSLEVRVPFLDTDVVEYTMSLPSTYKITPRTQKRVLKQAFQDVLPVSILERRKQGFDMPIGEWFKNELEREFTETVSGLNTDLFDTKAVMHRFADHKTGKGEHGKFLWSVYVFARWHRQMEERGVI